MIEDKRIYFEKSTRDLLNRLDEMQLDKISRIRAKNFTRAIRDAMENLANKFNMQFAAPPMNLCTDNGAMIAWAGIENYNIGNIVREPVAPRPRWPLTEL